MISSIVNGALKIGGAIFGGVQASKAAKKAKGYVEDQREKNEIWYKKNYNEDATQRADAQRMLTQVENSIRERNKEAAGAAAVMGGTEESVAAAKMANNQALADATSQIAANAANRKDSIDRQYREQDSALSNQLAEIEMNRAKAVSQAVSDSVGAATGVIGGLTGK